jgi:mRNA interferase RelE/StbE
VRTVRYTREAARDLKRHGNVADPVPKAVSEFAADPAAHANNVTQLVGSPLWRLRVGNFRAIFEETVDMITVTKVRPKGSAYD